MANKKTIIWTISGADCSGGAGIAADIKTGHSLGVEVCHLVTSNTVQNSERVFASYATDIEILNQQLYALIDDKPPAVVKIGLIANRTQINWLCQALMQLKQQLPTIKVVYDPVSQASVGGELSSVTPADLTPLWPLLDIITPNLPEAKTLTNSDNEEPLLLANMLQAQGINTVIIKGGHGEQDNCTDVCLEKTSDGNKLYQLSSEKLATSYSHGGGCSFASALACLLAKGYLVRDAFTLTKAFINQGLSKQQGKTDYYGAFEQTALPSSPDYFAKVSSDITSKYQQLAAFKSLELNKVKLGLYPVIDSIYWLKTLLPLKPNIIQLRLKNKSQAELASTIAEAVSLCKNTCTRLFINDYWQLAIKYQAYGVHIGQEDLQDADLAAIQQAGLRLGISTHGCYEFLLAQQLKPSYLAIGAIFPTRTKDMTGQIQGLDNLSHILNLKTNIPICAIGGINQSNIEQVWQSGEDSVAVVTAITEAEQPTHAIAALQAKLI